VARSRGRTFQVKFSNTLVVENHRSFFPASEAVMYLSGEPLHVITLNLVEKYRRARPDVPISFSAGVDARNYPDCAAMGFTPITTCTDLLRPGGYGRLPRYAENLEERMRALGVRRLGDYVVKACGRGDEAVQRVVPEGPIRSLLAASLRSEEVDLLGILGHAGQADVYDELVRTAARLNTPVLVEKATRDPRYHAQANRKPPRKIGSRLWLFDCVNCDKCVPVCPNDANFVYETEVLRREYESYRYEKGAVKPVPAGWFEVKKQHQIANFQDFCNECGNCDTFCPEDGGPYIEKPRFFGSLDAWKALPARDGFFAERADSLDAIWARIRGVEYHLEVDRNLDRALFTDGVLQLEVRHSERRVVAASAREGADEGRVLDFSAYLNMALAVDGVLDTRKANPVNAPYL
jgi:putative selenate reductase